MLLKKSKKVVYYVGVVSQQFLQTMLKKQFLYCGVGDEFTFS